MSSTALLECLAALPICFTESLHLRAYFGIVLSWHGIPVHVIPFMLCYMHACVCNLGMLLLSLPSLTMLNLDWTCVTEATTLSSLTSSGKLQC